MSELQQWTHIAIWALGATAAIVGLVLLVSHLCWRLLVHIKGWPIVFNAMRDYRKTEARVEQLEKPLRILIAADFGAAGWTKEAESAAFLLREAMKGASDDA